MTPLPKLGGFTLSTTTVPKDTSMKDLVHLILIASVGICGFLLGKMSIYDGLDTKAINEGRCTCGKASVITIHEAH